MAIRRTHSTAALSLSTVSRKVSDGGIEPQSGELPLHGKRCRYASNWATIAASTMVTMRRCSNFCTEGLSMYIASLLLTSAAHRDRVDPHGHAGRLSIR